MNSGPKSNAGREDPSPSDAVNPAGNDPAIGSRLREMRTRRGESLDAVATRAGLSRAFLSQVERGISSPSSTSMTRLAEALDVSLSSLFVPAAGEDEGLVEASSRAKDTYGGGHADELLSPSLSGPVLVLSCKVEPATTDSWGESYVHDPGEECVVLLDGRLDVAIEGDEVVELRQGDAMTFQSARPHRWRNPGPDATTAIWILVRGS